MDDVGNRFACTFDGGAIARFADGGGEGENFGEERKGS